MQKSNDGSGKSEKGKRNVPVDPKSTGTKKFFKESSIHHKSCQLSAFSFKFYVISNEL